MPIAFRLHYLNHSSNNIQIESILLQTTSAFAIVIASMTCLRPFLRPFDPTAFGSNATIGSRYAINTNKARNGFHELDNIGFTGQIHQRYGDLKACPKQSFDVECRVNEEDEQPLNNPVQTRLA